MYTGCDVFRMTSRESNAEYNMNYVGKLFMDLPNIIHLLLNYVPMSPVPKRLTAIKLGVIGVFYSECTAVDQINHTW